MFRPNENCGLASLLYAMRADFISLFIVYIWIKLRGLLCSILRCYFLLSSGIACDQWLPSAHRRKRHHNSISHACSVFHHLCAYDTVHANICIFRLLPCIYGADHWKCSAEFNVFNTVGSDVCNQCRVLASCPQTPSR